MTTDAGKVVSFVCAAHTVSAAVNASCRDCRVPRCRINIVEKLIGYIVTNGFQAAAAAAVKPSVQSQWTEAGFFSSSDAVFVSPGTFGQYTSSSMNSPYRCAH